MKSFERITRIVMIIAGIIIAMVLASCSARDYQFAKGDTAIRRSLGGATRFEIISKNDDGTFAAWDLSTGSHVDRLAPKRLKLVKK